MGNGILNIYCKSCGSPAYFNIVRQTYHCNYCGSDICIEDALKEKSDVLVAHNSKLEESASHFPLMTGSCEGCGAELIFEEGEALSNCAFCGRSLARRHYVHGNNLPHSLIPFGVTKKEACEKLEEWCNKNTSKPESQHLRPLISEIKGFYLPYEMCRGPVSCRVGKRGGRAFNADGFLVEEFVNCSKQLDNQLLDAMEPYDLEGLQEFDFAYVAGQRVKVSDITEKEVDTRLSAEVSENYRPVFQKMWGSKAVNIDSSVSQTFKIPVLLPVYYIRKDNVLAAVNGQTGKVSVRAEKDSRYIEIPWWLKGLLVLIIATLATFGALYLGGMPQGESLFVTGMLLIVYVVVFFCMFDDAYSNGFEKYYFRDYYTSGERTFVRERERLAIRDEILTRKTAPPVFTQNLNGKDYQVSYIFRSPGRIIEMGIKAILVIFLPVIIALFINGFDFQRLTLGGSAVWFCIAVPVVPVIFIKSGIQELFSSPRIYILSEKGKKKRYRNKTSIKKGLKFMGEFLPYLFEAPICFAIWFGIAAFFVMIYLTAFGFE